MLNVRPALTKGANFLSRDCDDLRIELNLGQYSRAGVAIWGSDATSQDQEVLIKPMAIRSLTYVSLRMQDGRDDSGRSCRPNRHVASGSPFQATSPLLPGDESHLPVVPGVSSLTERETN